MPDDYDEDDYASEALDHLEAMAHPPPAVPSWDWDAITADIMAECEATEARSAKMKATKDARRSRRTRCRRCGDWFARRPSTI